jgi:hypothetical protein
VKQWLRKNRHRLVRAGVATITAAYSGQGDNGHFDGFRVIDRNGVEIYYDLGMEFRDLVEALINDVAPPGLTRTSAEVARSASPSTPAPSLTTPTTA